MMKLHGSYFSLNIMALAEAPFAKGTDTNFYESWNFNFGNSPLDWIQELLE